MASGDIAKVEALAAEVAEAHGLTLYDVELASERNRAVLRITLHKPDPDGVGSVVKVDECARVSRELSQIFDADEPFEGAYVLQVSSPGVERPLRTAQHFVFAVGERVLLTLDEAAEGPHQVEGMLEAFDEDAGSLRVRVAPPKKKVKKGQRVKIPPVETWDIRELALADVHKARTMYEQKR